jgi:CRISPR type IV-associated DEAD/DEAH-box helicase Csf4
VSAELDLLLTDLVIPAIPFGTNRTMTHAARVAYAKFPAEKSEAMMTFRQWLGRPVRREGLAHRRIWVLDGRLASVQHARWATDFTALLRMYEKVKPL